MATLTGGDVLIETLAKEGVRHVFSIPGGQLLTMRYIRTPHGWPVKGATHPPAERCG